jgi:nicotinate phosphoribosyltransferase
VFGGVYKLAAVEQNGEIMPRIKLSENAVKVTNPSFKKVWRLFDRDSGKMLADVLTLHDEVIDDTQPYEIFDPEYTYKRKTLTNFRAELLLVPVFVKGECVYDSPSLPEIQQYCRAQLANLWEEVKRFENPQNYYVDLSPKLWELKHRMLSKKYEV